MIGVEWLDYSLLPFCEGLMWIFVYLFSISEFNAVLKITSLLPAKLLSSGIGICSVEPLRFNKLRVQSYDYAKGLSCLVGK